MLKAIQVGLITCLGPCPEWDEDPVVVIRTNRRDHAYDLDGFGLDFGVRQSVWIRIERFKLFIAFPFRFPPLDEHSPISPLSSSHL